MFSLPVSVRWGGFGLPAAIVFEMFFCTFGPVVNAQMTHVRGRVTDGATGEALPGASVWLVGTYDGATTDLSGHFAFTTERYGAGLVRISLAGYASDSILTALQSDTVRLTFALREATARVGEVVITAGALEVSDRSRGAVLTPLDVVTVASAGADMYGALRTLPGAQVSTGDVEGLFVRGGTGSETQTFVDGLLMRHPFFASVPDFAVRGRFNPFLFQGTVFSTGGYSAQYGQAMSAVVLLETLDLPERTESRLSLTCLGASAGRQQMWERQGRAAGIEVNYTHLGPYFALVRQGPDFAQAPENVGGEAFFRQKTGANGLLKAYTYYNFGRVGFQSTAPDGQAQIFGLRNRNALTNLTWSGSLHERWHLYAGASVSRDFSRISSAYTTVGQDTFSLRQTLAQGRLMATCALSTTTLLRWGAEHQAGIEVFENERYGRSTLSEHFTAAFAEADLTLGQRAALRAGVRVEHSALLRQSNAAPRLSLSHRAGLHGQVSLAWGHFYQKGDSLLRWREQWGALPGFQRAEHFIVQYQWLKDGRLLRAEAFYKRYAHLVSTSDGIGNEGYGHAGGLELFARDRALLGALDGWVSYSFLDTRRRFWWYPTAVEPPFAARHTVNAVARRFFPKLQTNLSLSYSGATGRTYWRPGQPAEALFTERTPAFHNLSISVSYLTRIGRAFAIAVVSVQNVPGVEQVFSYRFSPDGQTRQAITPPARRFFFAGLFLNWGADQRREVLENF